MRTADPSLSQTLLQHVERWPGSNLRQVHRATGIPLATTRRHLELLIREGQVRMDDIRGYTHFFPVGTGLHKRERILLGFLGKPRPRQMLQVILEQPGIRHSDLAEEVGLPAPTVTYYLKQLVTQGLVVVRAAGIQRHYRVKNPAMLETALARTAGGYDPDNA